MQPERYFYHSFPRRGKKCASEEKLGLDILRLITEFGLLLTQEVTSWEYPHSENSSSRKMQIVQKRACFTELAPSELPRHAEEFGNFTLEFETEALKELGALPVFYIAMGPDSVGAASLGQRIVMQIVDAMCLMDRIARTKKWLEELKPIQSHIDIDYGFDNGTRKINLDIKEAEKFIDGITFGVTPTDMLRFGLEGALNFFYAADADSTRKNSALKYYRQREWRIAANVARMGKELMGLPPVALIDRLIALDSDFFARKFPKEHEVLTNPSLTGKTLGKRLVDWIYVYHGIDDRHVVGAARRVIVPRAAVSSAKDILSHHPKAPPVVTIEDLT
jgi:hypothetical protein